MDSYSLKSVGTLPATEPAKTPSPDRPILGFPASLVSTPQGKLYILDRSLGAIWTVERGVLVKLAGSGTGFRNGPALEALFSNPTSLCLSATNGVLIADSGNHAIRLWHEGELTTYAGANGEGKVNGKTNLAKFSYPNAVAFNAVTFDVYVADSGNNCIRLISNTMVSDYAGVGEPGKVDGPALTLAKFRAPEGLLVTSTSDVLVADTKNHLIRLISNGIVTTLAGDGTPRFGDGTALEKARFESPTSLCLSPQGDLVIIDTGNNRIRLYSNGNVTTIAGSGDAAFKEGSSNKAAFNCPTAAVWTPAGHLLIADGHNHRIRVIEDETHVPKPDFSIVVDLHEKPEKFSIALGDVDINVNGKIWHLQKDMLQLRCPAALTEPAQAKLKTLQVSPRGQKLFWLFVYKDTLPEGQYGATFNNIRDWIEIHQLAAATQLDRLASLARWRVSYLLSLCESPETFEQLSYLVVSNHADFIDSFLDMVAIRKNVFGGNFASLERALQSASYNKLLSRSSLTLHPTPRPTTLPTGHLSSAMESLCPTKSSEFQGNGLLQLVAEGHCYNIHPFVLVSRWPLVFKWFFTRPEQEKSYKFPSPDEPGGLTSAALCGLLRYFYTGKFDGLKGLAECKLISAHAADLALTTESCGVLLSYVWQREGAILASNGDKSGEKCNVM